MCAVSCRYATSSHEDMDVTVVYRRRVSSSVKGSQQWGGEVATVYRGYWRGVWTTKGTKGREGRERMSPGGVDEWNSSSEAGKPTGSRLAERGLRIGACLSRLRPLSRRPRSVASAGRGARLRGGVDEWNSSSEAGKPAGSRPAQREIRVGACLSRLCPLSRRPWSVASAGERRATRGNLRTRRTRKGVAGASLFAPFAAFVGFVVQNPRWRRRPPRPADALTVAGARSRIMVHLFGERGRDDDDTTG